MPLERKLTCADSELACTAGSTRCLLPADTAAVTNPHFPRPARERDCSSSLRKGAITANRSGFSAEEKRCVITSRTRFNLDVENRPQDVMARPAASHAVTSPLLGLSPQVARYTPSRSTPGSGSRRAFPCSDHRASSAQGC